MKRKLYNMGSLADVESFLYMRVRLEFRRKCVGNVVLIYKCKDARVVLENYCFIV